MADRDIKDISVEILGDANKLTTALQGVNRDIRKTQTQLKEVDRLLKLDPSNTEMVSQKQKLLARSGYEKQTGDTEDGGRAGQRSACQRRDRPGAG